MSWQMCLGRSHLLPVDFEDFMPEEQAAEAFSMLDPVGTGKITLDNLRDIVVVVFQCAHSLSCSAAHKMVYRRA